jgi:hypothetical protein
VTKYDDILLGYDDLFIIAAEKTQHNIKYKYLVFYRGDYKSSHTTAANFYSADFFVFFEKSRKMYLLSLHCMRYMV